MPIPQLQKKVKSPHNWKKTSKTRKRSHLARHPSWRKTLLKTIIGGFIFLTIIGLIGVSLFFTWVAKDLPEPGKLQERILPESTKIYDRSGETLLYEIHGDKKRTLIKLNELPDYTIQAFIALEDKNFFQHSGLSFKHIIKAGFFYTLNKLGLYHGLVPGGSTLTQQFVKNSILTREKTLMRKIKEWILAYQIEKKFSKEQILEFYFNEIPFGSTAYGIESAAQTYFGKSARDLTLAESAILAAMIQRPTYYSPFGSHVDELFRRQHFVLDEMTNMGFISKEEAKKAKEEKIEFKQSVGDIKAPHFVFYVKELLTEKYGERLVEQGGLKVYTTLDMVKQRAAEEAITKQAEINAKKWEAQNAALVALDPKTGEILAMIGSRDFFNQDIDGQVNVALRPRQPGSSFKPIVYTAAWQKGYYPETVVFDVITKFKTDTGKDYEPHNYDDKEHGPVSLRQALQGSLNIPAVKVIYLTGIDRVLDLAEKLGYTTLKDRSRFGLSLVLGGGEVTLLEHTAAFGVLAREGNKHKTVAILKVEDNQGRILEEFKPDKGEVVIDPQIARITNYVLSDDEARAYVFGSGSLLSLPDRPVAAKTGTTNDYRDAWTVGYTPSLVTGVWVGNNDNSPMKRGASGYQVATPIWNNFMKKVLTGTPVEQFKTPEYTLPDKPMLNGSLGIETTVKIDAISGLLATEYTPEDLVIEKTFRELHNILYFVDKDNPTGPIPGENSTDPQYDRWEEAVQRWIVEQNISTSTPPTQYDNIHTPENKPILAILEPTTNRPVSLPIPIRIEWSAKLPLKKIEFYIDDLLIYQQENNFTNPFAVSLSPPTKIQSGEHYLKVVIYDEVKNSALAWEKIIIK